MSGIAGDQRAPADRERAAGALRAMLEAQDVGIAPERIEQLAHATDAHRRDAALMRAAVNPADEPADIFVPLRRPADRRNRDA